jgi:hypothetical protein
LIPVLDDDEMKSFLDLIIGDADDSGKPDSTSNK